MSSTSTTDINTIQKTIQGQRLDRILPHGSKIWTLSFHDSSKSNGVTFSFLGAGANKMVFRILIHGTPSAWVLCFQGNEGMNPKDARNDFEGEIDTLVRLGKRGVPVPAPFPTDAPSPNFLFQFEVANHDSGFDGNVFAFIIKFLDLKSRYLEMDKKEKDPGGFMRKCLRAENAHKNLTTTVKCFMAIEEAWKAQPWGDFQVLYDLVDGTLMVFDPMPKTLEPEKINKVLAEWGMDLKAAGGSHF